MRTLIFLLVASLFGPSVLLAEDATPKLKVCLLSGSEEYHSDASLAAFQRELEAKYPATCVLLKARGTSELPGLEALDGCDVAVFFTRRLEIGGKDLERVRKYCESGRPVVAIRTASHGFQNWLEFDKLVLGGNYKGHYSNDKTTKAVLVDGAQRHPVMAGVEPIASRGSLYKTAPLASDATPLMMGSTPEGTQPVTWVRTYQGGRVFYTSLGAPGDFENDSFRRLLTNAVFWAAGREAVRKASQAPGARPRPEGALRLKLRSRVEPFKGSGEWKAVDVREEVPVANAAILICDMWDKHWCEGASTRCASLAKEMAPVVDAARARGVQIIHSPSETMGFYADRPQRLRMKRAPASPARESLKLSDPPLPIDDSDGGCDTDETPYQAWTRQDSSISIGEFDGISDDGKEVENLLRQQGITHLLVMGVHTNMCVLGRSFGIREMTRRGFRCVLVRDLTDTMYDPKDSPHVAHDEGTELVVRHIEMYWAPSITSRELLEGVAP